MRKLTTIALVLLAFAGIGSASAQSYPSRPITIVVPYPAGVGTDALTRILAERMRVTLGQPIVVENVSGGGGSIGTGKVARAAPDGYTLSIGHWQTHVTNGAVLRLDYDLLNDFVPIALVAESPQWIVARKDLPAKNLNELIAWVRENPGKALVGTVGVGDPSQIAGLLFEKAVGASLQFVPYRGAAPMYQDLLAGRIDLVFGQGASSIAQVRSGNLKGYAVMARARWWAAPDVPTLEEAGFTGLYASFWYGLWAPRGTPSPVTEKLARALQDALADPAVQARLHDLGLEPFPRDQQTPGALAAYQNEEVKKWWPIIKAAGIAVQ